jgi:hypothetical protein
VYEGLSDVYSLCAVVIIRNGASIQPCLGDHVCIFKSAGTWQMRHMIREDEDDPDEDFSYDSKLTLNQNIKQMQSDHGRMHVCRVVYERMSAPPHPRAPAYSSSISTTAATGLKESMTVEKGSQIDMSIEKFSTSTHLRYSLELNSDILQTTLSMQDMSADERAFIRMRQHFH